MRKLTLTIEVDRSDGEPLNVQDVERALGEIGRVYDIGASAGGGNTCGRLGWKWRAIDADACDECGAPPNREHAVNCYKSRDKA